MKDPLTKQEVDIRKLSYEQAYKYLQQAGKGEVPGITEYEVGLLQMRLVVILEQEIWHYPHGKAAVKAAVEGLGKTPLKVEWGTATKAEYDTGKVFINAPANKNDGMGMLVFELTNIAITPAYQKLDKLAEQGLVSREIYIWENERLELENSLLNEILFVQEMLSSERVTRKDFGPRLLLLCLMGGKHIGDLIKMGTSQDDVEVMMHFQFYATLWDKFYKAAYEEYVKKNGTKKLYEGEKGTVVLPELKFPEDTLSSVEVDKRLYDDSENIEDFLKKIQPPTTNTTQKKQDSDDEDDMFS